MGGEKCTSGTVRQQALGSPPHGRGKGLMDAELSNAVGITPARAGKRDASLLLEKLPYGSPPRGQGKVLAAGLHNLIDRITPAWAGKRGPGPVKLGRSRDHPRVGGEKYPRPLPPGTLQGSPPRGRGKVLAVPSG